MPMKMRSRCRGDMPRTYLQGERMCTALVRHNCACSLQSMHACMQPPVCRYAYRVRCYVFRHAHAAARVPPCMHAAARVPRLTHDNRALQESNLVVIKLNYTASIRFRNCMCRNLHDNYMSRIMAYDLYRVLNGSAGHTCSGEHVAAIHLRIYRGKAP